VRAAVAQIFGVAGSGGRVNHVGVDAEVIANFVDVPLCRQR